MATKIERIVAKIQVTEEELKDNACKALPLLIELARHYRNLRRKAHGGTWARVLKKLGCAPRVASRYLLIAENWPDADRTPGSDLMGQLPADPHKLEWLCRLPEPDLRRLAAGTDLRQADRALVIREVKTRLGGSAPGRKGVTPEAVLASLEKYEDTLLGTVEQLRREQLQPLIPKLEARLDALKKELHEVQEEPPSAEMADAPEAEDDARAGEEDPDEDEDREEREGPDARDEEEDPDEGEGEQEDAETPAAGDEPKPSGRRRNAGAAAGMEGGNLGRRRRAQGV